MQLMNPNKIEAKFLRDLFTSFDASKLGYCVLRNHRYVISLCEFTYSVSIAYSSSSVDLSSYESI